MLNLKYFKIKNFIKLDLRWKLKRIGKHIGIDLYPKLFRWYGFRGLYSKFIFNLVFFSLAFKKKNEIYEEIVRISKKTNVEKNFLISPPSSGSNYLRGILSSFIEIYYNIGNGIPKFNSLTNEWIYSISPVKRDTLFHHINNQNLKEKFRDKFLSDHEFSRKMIIFSRYPFITCDLFRIKNNKKIILIREPIDWIVSRYTQFEKNIFYKEGEINKKLIDHELYKLNKFLLYWLKNLKENDNNFLIVKFEELVKNPMEKIVQIFKFYDYDTKNHDLVKRSIEVNSKEFALTNLNVKFVGTRFKDPKIKTKNHIKIKDYCYEVINSLELDKNYSEILRLGKK